jgi:hypothetical protein
MSWVDDELDEARVRDDQKATRDQTFREQAPGLWSGLRHFLKQDVEQINKKDQLVELVLGGSKLNYQEDGDGVKIVKETYPAMYLTIQSRGRYIEVLRKIVTNGDNRKVKEERNVYEFVFEGDERLVIQNPNGVTLGVADASQEILTPLLRTYLVK